MQKVCSAKALLCLTLSTYLQISLFQTARPYFTKCIKTLNIFVETFYSPDSFGLTSSKHTLQVTKWADAVGAVVLEVDKEVSLTPPRSYEVPTRVVSLVPSRPDEIQLLLPKVLISSNQRAPTPGTKPHTTPTKRISRVGRST